MASTLEMQDLTAGRWFEISAGGLDAASTVRGSDTVIPGKAGSVVRNRVSEALTVVLHGILFGDVGATSARESYRTRMAALKAIFDPTAVPFALTIYPDATGVGGGLAAATTATLNVRFLRFTGPPAIGDEVRQIDIECECVDSPPAWVIA